MIFRQNLGINRFYRTVVICTFKIQIYVRVRMEIFTRYQNMNNKVLLKLIWFLL